MAIWPDHLAVFYVELLSTMGSRGDRAVVCGAADCHHAMGARIDNFAIHPFGVSATYPPNVRSGR